MSTAVVGQKFEVQVIYNGVTKSLAVEPHQNMTAVVQLAAHLFGIADAHTLALFKEDGSEVPVNQSVTEAGLRPGELLALRPSAVRGG